MNIELVEKTLGGLLPSAVITIRMESSWLGGKHCSPQQWTWELNSAPYHYLEAKDVPEMFKSFDPLTLETGERIVPTAFYVKDGHVICEGVIL